MKIKNWFTYFVLVLILSGCVSPNYVTNITSHGSLENTHKKTATVIGLDRVFIHDFEKTFNKNFESTLDFTQSITEEFAGALVAEDYVHTATVDFLADWIHINTMTSKKSYLTIQNLFDECTSDYLVCLDDFKVKRRMEVSNNMNMSGDMNASTNSSREFIILLATVKIYNVKTHEPIVEYDVMGEDQVLFFSYTNSMMDAKEKLIANSLDFLKNYKK